MVLFISLTDLLQDARAWHFVRLPSSTATKLIGCQRTNGEGQLRPPSVLEMMVRSFIINGFNE